MFGRIKPSQWLQQLDAEERILGSELGNGKWHWCIWSLYGYTVHLFCFLNMVMPQQQDSSEDFGDTLTRPLPKATIQVSLKPWASALYILRADHLSHLGQIVVQTCVEMCSDCSKFNDVSVLLAFETWPASQFQRFVWVGNASSQSFDISKLVFI